jgi:hypothetical protein
LVVQRAASVFAALCVLSLPHTAAAEDLAQRVTSYRPVEADKRNFSTIFYFHRSDVTAQAAEADLRECHGYATGVFALPNMPKHIPAETDDFTPQSTHANGLVGDLIFSAVSVGLDRRAAATNLRRCMWLKGYQRYGLSAELFKELNQGSPDAVLPLLARIASGPAPAAERIDP